MDDDEQSHLAPLVTAGKYLYYTDEYRSQESESLDATIEDSMLPWFKKMYAKTPYKLTFTFGGYSELDPMKDLALIFFSVLFVWGYIMYQLGSGFIATCGILQVFASFFEANLIYRYAWPSEDGFGFRFFTLFCGLSLFIIMGIGADDIFVFTDLWSESSHHEYSTIAHRMGHVFGHAGKAMLITSLTTTVSFFANLSSGFIGVQTFGIFSGLLVICNCARRAPIFCCVLSASSERCACCCARTQTSTC